MYTVSFLQLKQALIQGLSLVITDNYTPDELMQMIHLTNKNRVYLTIKVMASNESILRKMIDNSSPYIQFDFTA